MIDIIARALAAQAASGGKGSSPQDLTTTALTTLNASEWAALKNVTVIRAEASVTGLDPEYTFIKVKITINSNDYDAVLIKNSSASYVGEINIEENDILYEIGLVFNGTNKLIMKCTAFAEVPDDSLYNSNGEVLFDSGNNVLTTTED